MVTFIERTPQWKTYVREGASNITLLGDALKQAFEDLDASLRVHQDTDVSGQDTSGCTANTAMITPTHIICANAGDSRCVLGTNMIATGLSEDHKPYDDNERKRIEAAGGSVQWKRVDGDLAVSRALGDFQYKTRPDLPATHQKVTFLPDITVHRRTPQDEVLILACDGLWDVMSNNEAIDFIRKILLTGESSLQNVAEEMVDIALEKGLYQHTNIGSWYLHLHKLVFGRISG
jgi:serine/threonine protein phosphatase PrpC